MERVLQRPFKPRNYHTIAHTIGTFGGGKYHHGSGIFQAVKTLILGRLQG